MDVLYPRCCGIDIHKKSITVCVLIREPGRKEQKHIREFGTTTAAILSCGDWLRDLGVTHVAIAYASHCTSLGRCETFSINRSLLDNLTPLAFLGGSGLGSS
jgi:hypothetical protein